MTKPKLLSSTATIRFQDCDPYGHLYNARYIDYFMNAREDQLIENYDLDIYAYTRETGRGWVVGMTQIAYLEPATMMERVRITSRAIALDATSILVEFQMQRKEADRLKAVMWSKFIHFDIRKRQKSQHAQEFLAMFGDLVNPVQAASFQERVRDLRNGEVT